ncbi:aldo/keto reductase [Acuticoccus sp. MNP-M23]|uniref:aldo/keto reductase n=1 Tax=Acuticoccus sp. MNP-M23 TaxID=3072793 RepID=UPI002814E7C3|nr:aldo/keto reductase [Acuticoccus sp. MNP-M23]WMS42497.1 aldo/keto reductase [Acuticoccus sp. MNP-M23]
MKTTFLGSTGLRVSEYCLGTMTFGTETGWGADEAEAQRIFAAYTDAGGNFIDTANAYTGGTAERMVGKFVAGMRDSYVIATKYTISEDKADPNGGGNHRKSLARAIDASLKRLGTDHIDLYYAHMFDGFTPIEEVMRALDDAVRAGKILYVGLSDFPAWMVSRADLYAEMARLTRPACIQIEYNLAMREGDRELVPMADALGLSVLDWSPLGGGALTGKLVRPDPEENYEGRVATSAVARTFDKYKSDTANRLVSVLIACAEEIGTTPARLALAWLRAKSDMHIPVVGARSARHVADNLKAADLIVPEDVMAVLEEASAIPLGFPTAFIRNGQQAWFADQPQRLDPRARPVGRRFLGL